MRRPDRRARHPRRCARGVVAASGPATAPTPTTARSASSRRPTGAPARVGSLAAVSEPRRFFVRTFGCQMNEHDSERIAGLLEADGIEEATTRRGRRRRRPQHVLHPRERRQQAVRHPRPPQVAEGPQARHADRRRPAAWPRRTATSSPGGRRTSTWCSAPTTSTGPPSSCTRPRPPGRSIVEILEETVAEDLDTFPSALPVRREVPWAGWVTIQIGCDNTCAFCIVPAVRGKEISRPFDDIVRRGADSPRRTASSRSPCSART